jgi:hypothetical protein
MKKWFFILVVFQVNNVLGQSWDISRPVNPLDGIYRLAFQKADSSDACMFPQVFGIDRQYLMGQNDSIGMNGFTIIPSVSRHATTSIAQYIIISRHAHSIATHARAL